MSWTSAKRGCKVWMLHRDIRSCGEKHLMLCCFIPILCSEVKLPQVLWLHTSLSPCQTPLVHTGTGSSSGAPWQRGSWISAGVAGDGKCWQEEEQPQDQLVGPGCHCCHWLFRTQSSDSSLQRTEHSRPQEHLPFADMNFAGNSQQRSDKDGFESLRKGQGLADVTAALLTGTQVHCDPACSLLWFVMFGGLIWGFPELQHHTGILLFLSYHLTPGEVCVCETWAENQSSVLLFSLSPAWFTAYCCQLPAGTYEGAALPWNPWTLCAGTQGSTKGLLAGRSSKQKYSSASTAHHPTAVGVLFIGMTLRLLCVTISLDPCAPTPSPDVHNHHLPYPSGTGNVCSCLVTESQQAPSVAEQLCWCILLSQKGTWEKTQNHSLLSGAFTAGPCCPVGCCLHHAGRAVVPGCIRKGTATYQELY